MKQILMIDDEEKILEVTRDYLQNKGYKVFTAVNGIEGLEILSRENISLLILDLMLPGQSGETLCRKIRKQSRIPIIMLTAKGTESQMIYGLECGADDYMKKPFSLKELEARVAALLRRAARDLVPLCVKNSFRNGDLVVDFEKDNILKNNQEVSLTPSEKSLLRAFIKYPQKVFTREELIQISLGEDFNGFDRAVDSHIKNLRQKIEDNPKEPVYVRTVRGQGYKFGGNG